MRANPLAKLVVLVILQKILSEITIIKLSEHYSYEP